MQGTRSTSHGTFIIQVFRSRTLEKTALKKFVSALLMAVLLAAGAVAADIYQTGKIVKWDNGNYPDGKKTKNWIVYQVQGDSMLYSIARHKETKPQMQPGDIVRYDVKGNQMTLINAKGKKNNYQIVGQSQAGQ